MLANLGSKLVANLKDASKRVWGILNHPPGTNWKFVEETKLQKSPYVYIGAIYSIDDYGEKQKFLGTGWRTDKGYALTAAHVLAAHTVDTVRCFFPNGETATYVAESDIPYDYYDQYDEGRVGSEFDIGVMRLDNIQNIDPYNGLPMKISQFTTKIWAFCPGYYNGDLVDHLAHLKRISKGNTDHMIHSAPTDNGHSGAPIIQNDQVVGIHVGRLSILRPLYPDQVIKGGSYDNAAITLNQFILDQIV